MDQDAERFSRLFMRRDTGAGTNLSRTGRHDPESTSYIHWLADDESTWPGEVVLDAEELRYYEDTYSWTRSSGTSDGDWRPGFGAPHYAQRLT
ncbi:hypothetical protein AB4Z09_23885 [Rhodococcus sp. TAF43]|uniref:hypothetical protein n=1 Tax=Rhodococcus sp. TAF43 TaxID=3237483 RepID=UPI003F972AE8